jgi:hypothetical protein
VVVVMVMTSGGDDGNDGNKRVVAEGMERGTGQQGVAALVF